MTAKISTPAPQKPKPSPPPPPINKIRLAASQLNYLVKAINEIPSFIKELIK